MLRCQLRASPPLWTPAWEENSLIKCHSNFCLVAWWYFREEKRKEGRGGWGWWCWEWWVFECRKVLLLTFEDLHPKESWVCFDEWPLVGRERGNRVAITWHIIWIRAANTVLTPTCHLPAHKNSELVNLFEEWIVEWWNTNADKALKLWIRFQFQQQSYETENEVIPQQLLCVLTWWWGWPSKGALPQNFKNADCI